MRACIRARVGAPASIVKEAVTGKSPSIDRISVRRTIVASARADAKQLAVALEAASGIVSFESVLNDTV